MIPLNKTYTKGFFSKRRKHSWRAPIVCGVINDVLAPKTLIDIGCATGDLVQFFLQLGIDAYGLEGSEECLPFLEAPRERITIADLRTELDLNSYDVALCLEVAEHIEPEYATIFVSNLFKASKKLVLSIAGPGQVGQNHVNLQSLAYWDELFGEKGYIRDDSVAERIARAFAPYKNKDGIKCFYRNLTFYEEKKGGSS